MTARELYYLIPLAVSAVTLIAIRKKSFSIIDLLMIFIATIPFHSFRFGASGEITHPWYLFYTLSPVSFATTQNFIRLSEIAFIFLLTGWLIHRASSKPHHQPIKKEFIILALFLLCSIISIKNSIYPFISIKRVLILSYLFFLVFMITDIVSSKKNLSYIIRGMIVLSSLVACFAVMQSLFPRFSIFESEIFGPFFGISLKRANTGWHDANYCALYLTMNACITLAYLLSNSKAHGLTKLSLFIQTLGIFSTFSRAAIISFIIISIYTLFIFRKKYLSISLLVVFLSALSFLLYLRPNIYEKDPLIAKAIYRIEDKQTIEREPELVLGHRVAAIKANWKMFLAHPFIGVGPFMSIYNFPKYKPSNYIYDDDWISPHNQYMAILSERGFIGFILFYAFVFVIIRNINILLKRLVNNDYRPYFVGLKASLYALLIFSLAAETLYELQFWLTIGLILAIFKIIQKEHPDA